MLCGCVISESFEYSTRGTESKIDGLMKNTKKTKAIEKKPENGLRKCLFRRPSLRHNIPNLSGMLAMTKGKLLPPRLYLELLQKILSQQKSGVEKGEKK